jgi:hypothetical protein
MRGDAIPLLVGICPPIDASPTDHRDEAGA